MVSSELVEIYANLIQMLTSEGGDLILKEAGHPPPEAPPPVGDAPHPLELNPQPHWLTSESGS